MAEYICKQCGHIGKPKREPQGNSKLEFYLWVILLFPGIFYSIWRRMRYFSHCTRCDSDMLLSIDSLAGRALKEKVEDDLIHGRNPMGSLGSNLSGGMGSMSMSGFDFSKSDSNIESSTIGESIIKRDIREEIAELGRKNIENKHGSGENDDGQF